MSGRGEAQLGDALPRFTKRDQFRSGSSSFWAIGNAAKAELEKLRRELDSGAWRRRYADLEAQMPKMSDYAK